MVKRRQRCFYLLDCNVRLEPADHAQKACAAHHSFIGEAGNLERLCRPDLRDWVRPEPGCRHVRQDADNGVRGSIERNAAADHIRVATQVFLPKIFRHDGDVGALLLLRQEVASQNRAHAEHIKIVRGHAPAEDLHRVPDACEGEEKETLPRETVEQRLTIPKMLITRRRYPDVD